ncbi:MAG: MBL fold metallo-hydrolase [Candidatus Coproplasma sp.]
MEILYMGTGAAEGFPAMFCNCENCIKIREAGVKEYRTRSQVLIDGVLSVDFPPEAYAHSLRFGVSYSALRYILVTHSHMDHFYAHDFILRGYKYAQLECDTVQICGNSEVTKVFSECTAREMKPEVAPRVIMREVKPYSLFTLGEYRIISIPAEHSKTEEALLYFIEKNGKGYLHLYDTGNVSAEALNFLAKNAAKAQVVSYDCTFGEKSGNLAARHMGIADVEAIRTGLKDRGIIDENTVNVITHFSHNCNPTRDRLKEIEDKHSVVAAYDGMLINI